MIALLTSPVGRILFQFGAILLALVVIWFLYRSHVESIRQQALIEYNQQQLELVIQQQEENLRRLEALRRIQDQFSIDLRRRNEELDLRIEDIRIQLEDGQFEDREASPLLKETVRQLPRIIGGNR